MSKKHLSNAETVDHYLHIARAYAPLFFLLFLVAIYGFLAWRITTLTSSGPDDTAVAAQLESAGVPKVDPEVISKLQNLEDNSVSVQTLFDQARKNPFNE